MTTDLAKGTFIGSDNWGGNYVLFRKHTSPAAISVVNVGAKFQTVSGSGTFKAAVYADNAGVPDALLGQSLEYTGDQMGHGAPQEFSFPLVTPVSIANATDFWVAIVEHGSNGGFDMGDDNLSHGIRWEGSNGTDTTPPSPAGSTNANGASSMLWAQYNPGTLSYTLTADVGAFILNGQVTTGNAAPGASQADILLLLL